MPAFTYSCPFCHVDMTQRVRAAMLRQERAKQMRESHPAHYPVQVTCPNNHTATYLPPPHEQHR